MKPAANYALNPICFLDLPKMAGNSGNLKARLMIYDVNELKREIRIALDQNKTSDQLLTSGDIDTLSMEEIIRQDPDFIFVTTMGASSEKAMQALAEGIESNPAWAGLTAVKEGRYILLPKELFHNKPNHRWGESYEILADYLYAEEAA